MEALHFSFFNTVMSITTQLHSKLLDQTHKKVLKIMHINIAHQSTPCLSLVLTSYSWI